MGKLDVVIFVSSSFQQQMALASRSFHFYSKNTVIGVSEVPFQPDFFYLSFVIFKTVLGCSKQRFIAFSWIFKIHLKITV